MSSGIRLSERPSLIEGRSKDGGWVVEGRLYPAAMLIGRDGVRSFGPLALEDIGVAHLPESAELLLLGTGATQRRAPSALVALARERGTRIEAMDSNAAARTFNLLLLEQRPVAALLL